MDMDPPSAYAMTSSPAFATASASTTATRNRLDFAFSFPSPLERHDPFDLSSLSASASASASSLSSSMAQHNGSIHSKDDDDDNDDFGDFESVPAVSSIAVLPDFPSMNWTQNLYGSFSSGLDPSPISRNDRRKLSGSVDMLGDFTSVNSSSSSSSTLQSKKESGDRDAAFLVRSTGLGSTDSNVSPHLSNDFASENAHGTSGSVDIFSDFMSSSSSSNSKKESSGLEAFKTKSMDTYFDVHSKNFAFENLFDNHTLKNAHVSGGNVDLFSDFTASGSGSSSFQLKKESSKLDPSTTRSWEIDSDVHTKKHSSQDIFGEFTSTTSNKVTSMEAAPTVNVVTVQEEFSLHFPGYSNFPSIKDSDHFDENNGSLSKMSVEDDWGDFVEYSDSASTSITQQNKEDILPNTTALMAGNALTAPIVKAESLNGNSSVHMLNGLDFFDVESFSHANVDNDLLGRNDDDNAKAKAASRLPGLQRTQSANLTDEIRREEMPAPIPLSLFGEEEPEFGGSRDEPLQLIMPQFQGHSRIKSLSIDSLPLGGAVNFSQMIASLYPVAKPEFSQNDTFQMHIHDTEEKLNSKVRKEHTKVAGMFDGVNDNINSSEGDIYNHSLEVRLFDLNLAPSSKQGLMQDNTCMVEERNDEATSASLLHSASLDDQNAYIKAWANVLTVCASELQHALDVWNQAQKEGVQQDFLANLEAKRYFAAIGQIYVVSLILASTLNICKSWLEAGSNEIDSILASLQFCKDTWLQTNLKEAVQFSLEALKGFLPCSLVSWNGIENFPSAAQSACTQAPGYSDPICRLSLLPLLPFTDIGLSAIQWSGSTYFLPLANLWAKYVSAEAPSVPSIQFKSS